MRMGGAEQGCVILSWMLGLCSMFNVIRTQDTMFAEDYYDINNVHTEPEKHCNCAQDLIKMDEMVKQKLLTFEKRLMSNVDYKNRQLEKTLEDEKVKTRKLEHDIKTLHKELNHFKDTEEKHVLSIRTLRQHLHHHRTSIDNLESDNQQIKSVLKNMTSIVDGLAPMSSVPSTVAPSLIRQQTTTSKVSAADAATIAPFVPIFPKDCQEVYESGGMRYPGDYYIMIQPITMSKPFHACCKMTNASGWTVIQRRLDGTVDFYQDWDNYKLGFGHLEGEFWLGNDKIHALTSQGTYKLRIELEDWDGRQYFAEYSRFRVADEDDHYRLHIRGYHGTSGDSLTSYWENHDKQQFSTKDADHDQRYYDNCAVHYHGAWWFKSCYESHLNGIYYHKGSHSNYFVRNGIQWNSIHLHSSLKNVVMMVKPNTDAENNGSNKDKRVNEV